MRYGLTRSESGLSVSVTLAALAVGVAANFVFDSALVGGFLGLAALAAGQVAVVLRARRR